MSLGYFPNFEKSNLSPTRCMKHLGFTWNSSTMEISVPEDKVLKAKSFASSLLSSSPTLSFSPAFPFAPLYYRKLQTFHAHLVQSNTPWNSKVTLDQKSISDLTWWSKSSFPLMSRPFTTPQADFTLSTDASKSGWGGGVGGVLSTGQYASGTWSLSETSFHINYLEMMAVYFSFLSFLPLLRNSHVHLLSDNFTSVCFINKKVVLVPNNSALFLLLFGIFC